MPVVEKDDVHDINRLFNIANNLNFIKHNTNFDQYSSYITDDIRNKVKENLLKLYRPSSVPILLCNKIKLLVEHLGYFRKIENGFKMGIIERTIGTLERYFKGLSNKNYLSILGDFFIIETDDEYFNVKIIDVNWEAVQQQIFEYLFNENYITSWLLHLEYKILFCNAGYVNFNKEITLALINLKISNFDSDLKNYNSFLYLINKINFYRFVIDNDLKYEFNKKLKIIINYHIL